MIDRRYPIGPQIESDGVHFRVWAPDHRAVAVVIEGGKPIPLASEENGYFSSLIASAKPGVRYQFKLGDSSPVPDPASCFQPEGPHGPSQVIDSCSFTWTDKSWKGRSQDGLVIYEMHVGTFTQEGTWQAAVLELRELADLGINCIEVMPVADFVGSFGWGYDGVNLFAPTHIYGAPDDFRRFVNEAHRLGIMVILDVVYNHFGPDGNYVGQFAGAYFTDRYKTDWGAAINFDGEDCEPVREFVLTNVAYWIREFHLDGLRLDATQNIYDDAPVERHILTEIGKTARAAAPDRTILIVAENEPQVPDLCRPVDKGGHGFSAVWNDDFHHSAMVAMTGQNDAYYNDYLGNVQEFISAAKYGYLYQGQWYSWQKKKRGQSGLDLPASAFVVFLQNHDQVANTWDGARIQHKCSPGCYRAFTALTLLLPGTPMLFQGQEFAASSPFYYFADHRPELAKLVENGRKEFLSQFPNFQDIRILAQVAKPHDPQTFARCKLDFNERKTHAAAYALTKDLLKLRSEAPGFQPIGQRSVDGSILSQRCFVLRYFFGGSRDRIVVVNLGPKLQLPFIPDPLLAPPVNGRWQVRFSTEDPRYGGGGVYEPEQSDGVWIIHAESTTVLDCVPEEPQTQLKKSKS